MKEHVQKTGVRKYAGDDLIELQAEPLKVVQRFFEECGICVIQGCEVTPTGNLYNVAPGVVALSGEDAEGSNAFKVVPFAGVDNVSLPIYLTLTHTVVERAYADQKVKPIAYNYTAVASGVLPADGVPFLEITPTGGRKFVDAIKVTEKLDKIGNGKDVTVTFSEAPTRENVASGEKLSVLFGKVRKWFAGLATVAFSGKASDLSQDAGNRLVTDNEKTGWNDKYTKSQTDTKDTDTLTAAKGYTDTLSGNVYKKTETYNRTEVDNKDSATLGTAKSYTDTLSGNVYKKTETYTRSEIDTKDATTLQAAKNYAAQKVADVVNNSPAALDSLQELAAALGNDPNFATSIMALIGGKADSVHSHSIAQVANLQAELNGKEPTFAKKTAFNKDFGATAGTVCQGNDTRLSDARTPTTHSHPASQVTENANKRFVSDTEKNTWNNGKADNNHNHDSVYLKPTGDGQNVTTTFTQATSRTNIASGEKLSALFGKVSRWFADLKAVAFTGSAADITEQINKRFMTDAERTKIGFLSNIETPEDLSVIICAGHISQYGSRLQYWGKNRVDNNSYPFEVVRESIGTYKITHNYGKNKYGISAGVRCLNGVSVLCMVFPTENNCYIIINDARASGRCDDEFWFVLYKLR